MLHVCERNEKHGGDESGTDFCACVSGNKQLEGYPKKGGFSACNRNICCDWNHKCALARNYILGVDWGRRIGTALIALSVVSKGAVGMGDGLVLAALGTVLTFGELLGVFMMGLLCCSVWGIILLILPRTGRKTEIPFVPFLLLGYIGGLIY